MHDPFTTPRWARRRARWASTAVLVAAIAAIAVAGVQLATLTVG